MDEWIFQILQHEIEIRLSCFFGIFALMAMWEIVAPKRVLTAKKSLRWLNNIGLVFFNTMLLRFIFPVAAVSFAFFVEQHQLGLLHYLGLPNTLAILFAVIFLDFGIYLQHVMFHALPLLWQLHRMHHADTDLDVTSGARFHPIEIILSMLIKFGFILVLGAPALAVLLFEVILNAMAMFNHSNIRLPHVLDNYLRWFIITPDMHRVHHSSMANETDSNFGFNLAWWDRLFGTYLAQPKLGHQHMQIGLTEFRESKFLTLPWLLILPVLGKISRKK